MDEEIDNDHIFEPSGQQDPQEVPGLVQQAQELRRLSSEFATLKEDYTKRKQQDTYRFAELAEAEDYKLNLANSNRVMITGKLCS